MLYVLLLSVIGGLLGLVAAMHRLLVSLTLDPVTGFLKAQYREHLALIAGMVAWMEKRTQFVDRAPGLGVLYRRATSDRVWLIRLDVSGLAVANELGHANGDRYLRICANAIRQAFRSGKIAYRRGYWMMPWRSGVYRVGGDEFAVVLVGVSSDEADAFLSLVEQALSGTDPRELGGITPELPGGILSLEGAMDFHAQIYGTDRPSRWRLGLTQLVSLWDDAADTLGLARKVLDRAAFFADIYAPHGDPMRARYEATRTPARIKALTGFTEGGVDLLCAELRAAGWTNDAWEDDPRLTAIMDRVLARSIDARRKAAQQDLEAGVRLEEARRTLMLLDLLFGKAPARQGAA